MKRSLVLSCFVVLIFVFTILNALSVFAGPSRTTYQAKIIKPDGYPLEATSVNFKFTILDPAGSCILYSETFSTVNMGSTAGLVSFSLGTGVRTFPVVGSTFEQVFSNTTASLICDSGGPATYSPSANDTRKIVMQFNDGSGWQTLPAMTINAVPYAMYANDSLKFSGKDINEFVQVASLPTCGASEAIHFNGAGFSCITTGGSGTITSGSVITALGYTPADGASVTTITSTVDSVSSTVASVSSTVYSVSSTVTSLQNSVAASLAAITSSQWTTSGTSVFYNTGSVGIGTAQPEGAFNIAQTGAPGTVLFIDTYSGASGINPAIVGRSSRGVAGAASATIQNDKLLFIGARGDTGTGFSSASPANIILRASENWSAVSQGTQIEFNTSANGTNTSIERMKITNSGNIGIGTSNPAVKLDVSGAIRVGVDTSSCTAGLAGTIRYNAGVVEYCNGTTWAAFGVSGAGILAINGLTSGSQTFAFGNSGTTPNVSSTGAIHTFNFPYASVAATTAGVISYDDYLNFANKQSATSAAITATLGYTPADSASVTAVTSTVNSVSSAVVSLQNSVAASFSAMTSSQWVTSGTNISYNTGNVGIGTVNPSYPLDVKNQLRIGAQGGSDVTLIAGGSGYGSQIHQYYADGILKNVFSANGDSYITGGNFGIGTASPTAKLDVSGTVKISGGSPASGKVLTSDASGNATWQNVVGDNLGNHTATQNINLGTYKLVGQGGSEGITIDSSGNIRLGSVGGSTQITAGPGSSASGSSWASIAAGFNATASSITSFAFGSYARATNWYAFATGNNTTAAGRASAVFGQNMTVNGNYSVGFGLSSSVSYTANTPSTMVIMGGNVGIGTTTPAYKLSVYEEAAGVVQNVESGNNGSAAYTRHTGKTAGGVARTFGSGLNISGGTGGYEVYDFTAGASRMFINSSGDVGIGTTTPAVMLTVDDSGGTVSSPYVASTDKLVVMSSGNGVIQVTTPVSNTGAIYFSDPESRDPGGIAYSHLTDSLVFRANGATRMTIASGGAVGIGTGTPTAKLEINSGANTDAAVLATSNEDNKLIVKSWDTQPTIVQTFGLVHSFQGNENNGFLKFYRGGSTSGGFLSLGTSGAERLRIDTSGRVGIGTASPTATLHVDGAARIVDGNQAAGRALASDANGNASWKQTIIHGTVASTGNTSTAAGNRVSSGVYITLPPGKWQITGMGITTAASCRADFGIRAQATDSVVKYTLMPVATGDFQTATVTAYVDIASTTTYDLYINSRAACNSQIHVDNSLWELTATGIAY